MRPTILFLTHAAALGGAELYLLDIATHLRDQCAVAVLEEGPLEKKLADRGIETHVYRGDNMHDVRKKSGIWSSLRAAPNLLDVANRLRDLVANYDVVFANSQKALFVGSLAGRLAGRPVIWNLHDLLTPSHFSLTARRLATLWANVAVDHVVTNSEATRRAFRGAGGRVPTTTIYNGFDPAPFDEVTTNATNQLRASLGVDGHPVVGVFSRLAEWKGQHILLEALSGLSGIHGILVGDAIFSGDEKYGDTLRERAQALGMDDRIHFLGFRNDVPALMKAVDIVVHTSVAPEPFGRVIVEGMLAKRPVIATRAGGTAEIIEEGETGVLVPPGNPRALRHAIQALLDNTNRRRRIAKNGSRMARGRFSIPESATQIADLVARLSAESERNREQTVA